MLARVANSLYWTGRYIERSEHLARFLNVQYFSTFDAPMSQDKEVILRSILYMGSPRDISQSKQANAERVQSNFQYQQSNSFEQDILVEVALELENQSSIYASVKTARENARSVRYLISSELWETINRYYLFVSNYSVEFYKNRGLHDFTATSIQHCSVIRSYIDSSLLHDDIWAFLKLGIHLERAVQILRILRSKVIDIQSLAKNGGDNPLITYQWTITLQVLEAFDMYRRLHKGNAKQEKVIPFLLTNPRLFRSLAYTLEQLNFFLSSLSFESSQKSSLSFQASKLASFFKFLEYEEIDENLEEFLLQSLNKVYKINDLIQKEYFG
ncbi:MAG: alpha-E domain-containing protein [Bacteroidota bacterium]